MTEAMSYSDRASSQAAVAFTYSFNAEQSRGEAQKAFVESAKQAAAASNSAQEASNSASKALLSEESAKTSEVNSKASETASKASETAALTSETNAANSESNAESYKSSAKESETNASIYASNASKSETNAKAAMNSASTSAIAANTSASNAGKSATNASLSETAAKAAQAAAESARDRAEEVVTKLTGVMKYAGQVENYSDLNEKTTNKGDVWNVINADADHGIKAGDNVVWNGEAWDNLSGTIDFSIYAKKEDYTKAITSAVANKDSITFVHKDGTTTSVTIGNTDMAKAAMNDSLGRRIDETYETLADATNVHTSMLKSINELSSRKQDKLLFDTVPTEGSHNIVSSGVIKGCLDTKQDTLHYDTTPTEGSINPVTSSGIAESLKLKLDAKTGVAAYAMRDASGNIIVDTYATKYSIPTKVSQLENDRGYLSEHQDLSGYYSKTDMDNKLTTVTSQIEEVKKNIPKAVSTLENDTGYITREDAENLLKQNLDGKIVSASVLDGTLTIE